MIKAKELRSKEIPALYKLLEEKQSALLDLRLKASGSQLKNHRQIRETRREIARILTILREKRKEKK